MGTNELLIKINGSAKQFQDELDKAKKATKDFEKSLSTVAKVSTAAFVGLAASIGGAVARFSSFEKGFTNVVTLLDKGSFSSKSLEKGISDLKNEVIALGARSGESFENLNTGLFNLVSAGVPAEKSVAALEAATKLATAGATSTDIAVKALTASLTAFGEEAGSANDIAEKFFTAQKFGVTTVGELANEFNKVGGIAKNLGISFDETLASLSSLTANGAKPTAVAATELKAVFNALILAQAKLPGQSLAVQDALSLQNIQSRGLVESLDLLKAATGGSTVEMQRILGSAEALSAALSLTGAQSELVKTQIAEIGDASKRAAVFSDALAVKQQTVDFAMKQLRTSVDAVAVTFGEFFAPAINAVAKALSGAAQFVAGLDKRTVAIIGTILSIVTALTGLVATLATLGLAYIKVDRVIKTLNTTFGIAGKATAAYSFILETSQKALKLFRQGVVLATTTLRGFAAATGVGLVLVALSLLIQYFDQVRAVIAGTFAAARVIVTNVMGIISKLINDFVESDTAKRIGSFFDPFIDKVSKIFNFVKDVFTSVGSVIQDFVQKGLNLLGGFGDVLRGAFTLSVDTLKAGLDKAKAALAAGFSDIGKGAGDAYNEAYKKSIESSNPPEVPAPEIKSPEEEKKKGATPTGDPALQAQLEEKLKQEEAANARLREIRARENDLLAQEDRRAALERTIIKDEELKKLNDKEKEGLDSQLKIKQDQLAKLKEIDALESKNAEISSKEKIQKKDEIELEANKRQLEILNSQLDSLAQAETQNNERIALEQEQRLQEKLLRLETRAQEEQELKLALAELDAEQRALLDQQEIEAAQATLLTKREAEKQIAKEKLTEEIAARNKYKIDEAKFGKEIADLNAFFASQEVQAAKETSNQLVQLSNSKNATLKGIGKAASLVQIGIKTAEGAISAYSALAGIPIVGPALGAAAAAALVAYGAEQAAAVTSAQRGGIVPNGIGGSNDRIPAMLQPGELVVPAPLAPDFIQAVGRPEVDNERGGATEVVIGFTQDAIPYIEKKLVERRAIGTGVF